MPGVIANAQAGLKTVLEQVGLHAYDTVPDKWDRHPSAAIDFDPDSYDPMIAVGGTAVQAVFEVIVKVKVGRIYDAWDDLFGYIGPTGAKSIQAEIAEDDTLGGNVDQAWVTGASDFEREEGHPSIISGRLHVAWITK